MCEELNNEFPWLVFSIHEEQFAINSKYVASILHKNEEIVFVPHEHDYVKGLITFRESPIKLIDMRRLLNEESIEHEMAAFNEMIDKRKNDHIKWVNELERCSHDGEHFGLATDPHKCEFGKWYDNFQTDILTIQFHMNKIEEPHRLLHESASEYNACARDCAHCERPECLKVIVERAKTEYVAEVLELLDEAKNVFKDYFKEMIIAVEAGDYTFGFLVDEVIAVEDIQIMSDFSDAQTVFRSKFFNGVGKRKKEENLILLMDVNEMLKLQEKAEITHKQLLSLAEAGNTEIGEMNSSSDGKAENSNGNEAEENTRMQDSELEQDESVDSDFAESEPVAEQLELDEAEDDTPMQDIQPEQDESVDNELAESEPVVEQADIPTQDEQDDIEIKE